MRTVREEIEFAIGTFDGAPPTNDYQRGYLHALKEMLRSSEVTIVQTIVEPSEDGPRRTGEVIERGTFRR